MTDFETLTEEAGSTVPSKHELIVAAALKHFLETGYGATSMDSIANEAGVSKQTVYSHFRTKKALFAAVIGDMCRNMGGPSKENPLPDDPADIVLRNFGRKILEVTQIPQAMAVFRVIMAEGAKFPELSEILWEHGHEDIKLVLSGYLTEQIRRGVLDIPDADLAAEQFMGMVKFPHLMPTLLGMGPPPTDAMVDRTVDQATTIFLTGVSRPRT